MGNKVINLVLQHILRAHCTAAWYPRISVCILVLRHVFVIRDEFTSNNKLNLSHVPFLKIEVVFNLEKIKGCFRFGKHKRLSSIYKTILVVFQLQKKWGRLPFTKNTEVVFHLKKINWGRLPFTKQFMSFRIYERNWGRLPFTKKM